MIVKEGTRVLMGIVCLSHVHFLTAYAKEVGEEEWTQLLILAIALATKLEQECVLITIQRVESLLHWAKPESGNERKG